MPAIEPLKFNAPSLSALAAAFGRRGKALRYHGELSVTRETEGDIEQGDIERLNIYYSDLRKLSLRLSVWSTGDWVFLACQPRQGRAGGWKFKHELCGELGHRPAEAFVKSFEASQLIGYSSPHEQRAKLQELWHVSRTSGEA